MNAATTQHLLIICPGRGSYNRSELGYCKQYAQSPILQKADQMRADMGLPTISELDSRQQFSAGEHLKGVHTSALIFTTSLCDLERLRGDGYAHCAYLGNSMGFYTALVASGALSFEDGFNLIHTMGGQKLIGGQIIYPVVHGDWTADSEAIETVNRCLKEVSAKSEKHFVAHSIHLGGYAVLAGMNEGIRELLKALPAVKIGEREYPFQLVGHSGFHTAIMKYASHAGIKELASLNWQAPKRPLIDGRGHVWLPLVTRPRELFDYTLTDQVATTFDFSAAVRVGLREYGPDRIVLLGPGETLGGSIAQVLISEKWQGIQNRQSFLNRQKADPFLLNMGRPEHAALLT